MVPPAPEKDVKVHRSQSGSLLGTNLRLHTRSHSYSLFPFPPFLAFLLLEKSIWLSLPSLSKSLSSSICSCFPLALRHCIDLLSSLYNTPDPSRSPGASPYHSLSSLAQAGWLISRKLWETHQQSHAKALGVTEAAGTEGEEDDGKSLASQCVVWVPRDGESVLSLLLVLTHC